MVAPYDDPNIVLGQATAAYEVLEARPEIATFLVPIGGGGLLAGTSVTTAHDEAGCPRVVGRRAGRGGQAHRPRSPRAIRCRWRRRRAWPTACCRSQVGRLTFEYMRPMVHEAVGVTDDEIGAAVKLPLADPGTPGRAVRRRGRRRAAHRKAGPHFADRHHAHRRQRGPRGLSAAGCLSDDVARPDPPGA